MRAIAVLWRRDLIRFFRQKSRVFGALAQPLLFWLILGSGLAGTFALQGGGMDYRQYFFPGVVVMIVLFTSIFSTMSVIEDRHGGFLQAVLAAPAPRASIVLGKSLGGATIALMQAALFLVLAPLAGFDLGVVSWGPLALILLLTAVGLTALGFAIAWWLDSTQGYHAVMSVVLIPAWVLSGAMFPVTGAAGWLRVVMAANPATYAVAGVRRALHGGALPAGADLSWSSPLLELGVAAGSAALFLGLAIWAVSRRA
jgi:ABC-2 type transport system permease protein